MRKVVCFLIIIFTLQSCLQPNVYSVVDNTLFSKPYLDPQFYLLYSGKRELKIANEFSEKLRLRLEESGLYSIIKVIDLNEIDQAQLKNLMQKAVTDKSADVIFTFKLSHISLHESYGITSITDFNYLVTAYDYSINKEVWKSNVYSPWYGDSVNKSAKMFVDKLKSDKVL